MRSFSLTEDGVCWSWRNSAVNGFLKSNCWLTCFIIRAYRYCYCAVGEVTVFHMTLATAEGLQSWVQFVQFNPPPLPTKSRLISAIQPFWSTRRGEMSTAQVGVQLSVRGGQCIFMSSRVCRKTVTYPKSKQSSDIHMAGILYGLHVYAGKKVCTKTLIWLRVKPWVWKEERKENDCYIIIIIILFPLTLQSLTGSWNINTK